MKIDTTLNVKRVVLMNIDDASAECSTSRSHLISLLLKRLLKKNTTDKNRFSRVKYQKRDKKAGWKRPHVFLDYDLYEKCIDMRKVNKMSVSYLVFIAYTLYFDTVVDELRNGEETDNNLRQYIFIWKKHGDVFSYTVFWDFPPEECLLKYLE